MAPTSNPGATPGTSAVLPARFWLPLVVAAAVSGATLVVSELSYRSFTDDVADLGRGFELHARVLELEKSVIEAEAAQRGYLLSRGLGNLESFQRSVRAIPAIQREILDLAYRDKEVRDRLADLGRSLAIKVDEMQRSVKPVDLQHASGGAALLDSDEARQTNAKIRKGFAELDRLVAPQMEKHNLRWRDSMEASRSAIFTVVGLNVVLIAMLALLLIRDQRRLRESMKAQARQAERLESEVAKRTEELSSLSAFLQANSEREKAALARELHDELGGILTPAKMDLSWLQGHLGGDPACRERMQRLSHLIDEGIDLKRRIIESLRPSLLDHLGLAAALQWYVDETCKSANLDCKLNVTPNLERLPSDLEIALFRLVQESLNNIVKHARARHVTLSVERFAKGLRVVIADDGVGIPDLGVASKLSHGLAGMRHRVSSVHGTFGIESRPGHGTIIQAVVPLEGKPAPGPARPEGRAA